MPNLLLECAQGSSACLLPQPSQCYGHKNPGASKLLIHYAIVISVLLFIPSPYFGILFYFHPSSISAPYLGNSYTRQLRPYTQSLSKSSLLFFLHPTGLNTLYGSSSYQHHLFTDPPAPFLIIIFMPCVTISFVGSWADWVQVGTCVIPVLSTVAGIWLDSIHILNGQMHGISY